MIKRFFSGKNSITVLILIISFFLVLSGLKYLNKDESGVVTQNTDNWNTYVNEKYNFKLSYPKNWKVAEDFTNNEPKINIYKPEFKLKLPLDHFSEASHVSIYPKGIGSESVVGRMSETKLNFKYELSEGIDYLTKNNENWATFLKLKTPPKSWETYGFIWIKNKIIDPKYSCTKDNQEIPIEMCNPYDGDQFEREGILDLETQKIQNMIIESFEIIE